MTAKGYSNATLVAQELGSDLTAPQLDQIAGLLESVESWIDRQTGRAWLVPAPITDELYNVDGPLVYLKTPPVTSVTSVSVRSLLVGSTEQALVAGNDFELLDPLAGVLSLAAGWPQLLGYWGRIFDRYIAKVTYVATTPVPADIQRAATMLAAHWTLARLQPESQGVSRYRIASNGDEFETLFGDPSKLDVPPEVMGIVQAREAVIFA